MAHARAAVVEPATVEPVYATGHRVSWGAISAGVVFAVVTQLLLSLLGAGIGLTSVEPAAQGATAAKALGIGAAAWWTVSALVSMYAGGWMAARLSESARLSDGVYHGILMWCVSTLVSAFLLTSAVGGILGGTMGFVGKAFGLGAQQPGSRSAASNAAERQGIDLSAAQRQATSGDLSGAAKTLGRQVERAAGGPQAADQAEARATQAADTAADVGGAAFLIAFVSLLIGCLSAAFGGRVGYHRALRLSAVGTTL